MKVRGGTFTLYRSLEDPAQRTGLEAVGDAAFTHEGQWSLIFLPGWWKDGMVEGE